MKNKGGLGGNENGKYRKGYLISGNKNGMYGKCKEKHPNSKLYEITYVNQKKEILSYKECEKKFGIAFSRISENGGILNYKKKCKNSIYEGLELIRIK